MSQVTPSSPQTAIDQIANEGHLKLLKAAIPYVRSESQKSLAIYAKILELGNIVRFFSQPSPEMTVCSEEETVSALDMLHDIRLFCDESEKEIVDSCIHAFETVQSFSAWQEFYQKASSESQDSLDLVKKFLTPEQQAMFETYQTMFKA